MCAGIAGLLGVELRGRQRTVLDSSDERRSVLGPRDQWRSRGEGSVRFERPGLHGIRVDEVEPLVLDPGDRVRCLAPRTPRWRTEVVALESLMVNIPSAKPP